MRTVVKQVCGNVVLRQRCRTQNPKLQKSNVRQKGVCRGREVGTQQRLGAGRTT